MPKREYDEASEEEEPVRKTKVLSNKILDPSNIPHKPTAPAPKKKTSDIEFRLTITNGQLLRKFLEPVAHSVLKMKFMLCKKESTGFNGFRMEAHDTFLTLANKSRFECDIEGSETVFCVSSSAFMQALSASTLKDTTLCVTKYRDTPDIITFEAENNESDVRTTYTCALLENTQVQSLDNMTLNLGFHVSVHMSLLKELSLSAKKCGADTLNFDLWQKEDPKDKNIMHSKMTIGFSGIDTSGTHEFQVSAKKTDKTMDGETVTSWEPVVNEAKNTLALVKCGHNEYDNNKLRVFLNHMECTWVLVHLCNDNSEQPLVLEFILGSKNTKHCVIIAPRTAE
jgi:hypothetical protein